MQNGIFIGDGWENVLEIAEILLRNTWKTSSRMPRPPPTTESDEIPFPM